MWSRWRRFVSGVRAVGRRVARVQTRVLLTLVYFLVLPLFALSRLADPLGLRSPKRDESLWGRRPPVEPTVERFTHLF